eukprot:TRINITY_DN87148_c0_g1_i1.p1 TRINITY_DN87148_c0_g1~~TRINITY_DN87148_c0_g1_i1.p1  ORF type:complete len:243 (-),score=-30.01 TRINITY_DN87148_c0_g1_i1:91-819(-)
MLKIKFEGVFDYSTFKKSVHIKIRNICILNIIHILCFLKPDINKINHLTQLHTVAVVANTLQQTFSIIQHSIRFTNQCSPHTFSHVNTKIVFMKLQIQAKLSNTCITQNLPKNDKTNQPLLTQYSSDKSSLQFNKFSTKQQTVLYYTIRLCMYHICTTLILLSQQLHQYQCITYHIVAYSCISCNYHNNNNYDDEKCNILMHTYHIINYHKQIFNFCMFVQQCSGIIPIITIQMHAYCITVS